MSKSVEQPVWDPLAAAPAFLARGIYDSEEALTWRAVLALAQSAGGLRLRHERMNVGFEKWHVEGLPFCAALHRFTAPDEGDPHDHPWGFTSHVLAGGYRERVFNVRGQWGSYAVDRPAGTVHQIEAEHVHRIEQLLGGECWTLCLHPGAHERQTRFWRFECGRILSRQHDSATWEAHA